MSHERQGSGYDPDAAGHELAGRQTLEGELEEIVLELHDRYLDDIRNLRIAQRIVMAVKGIRKKRGL